MSKDDRHFIYTTTLALQGLLSSVGQLLVHAKQQSRCRGTCVEHKEKIYQRNLILCKICCIHGWPPQEGLCSEAQQWWMQANWGENMLSASCHHGVSQFSQKNYASSLKAEQAIREQHWTNRDRNLLVGVIVRFRQETVAVMANVEAMFHQFRVNDEHTDLLRFLWWPDGNYKQELVEHKMLVLCIFDATSSLSIATGWSQNSQERFLCRQLS